MHEKFIEKFLENNNPEGFLPQNLPINLLYFMLNVDNEDSAVITTHAVATIYKHFFNTPPGTKTSAVCTSSLFKSCFIKYTTLLVHEQDYRLKLVDTRNLPTTDDIFYSIH